MYTLVVARQSNREKEISHFCDEMDFLDIDDRNESYQEADEFIREAIEMELNLFLYAYNETEHRLNIDFADMKTTAAEVTNWDGPGYWQDAKVEEILYDIQQITHEVDDAIKRNANELERKRVAKLNQRRGKAE